MSLTTPRMVAKTLLRTLSVCGVLYFAVGCVPSGMTIQPVDPLINIYPCMAELPAPYDTIRVARGENAVVQFVVSAVDSVAELIPEMRSLQTATGATLADAQFGWVQCVRSSHQYAPPAPDALPSPKGLYPDPIRTDTTAVATAQAPAVLWLDIPIARDAKAGTYAGVVRVQGVRDGRKVAEECRFVVEVYPVTLPKQSLKVTNWFFPEKFAYMNHGEPVADDSPAYWECMEQLVKTAAAYGQNVWLLYETGTPVVRADGSGMDFDFARMDKNIEFLLRHVDVELIEANHFAKRSHNGWVDPFWANVPVLDGKGGSTYQRLPYNDPRVESYIATYFAQLQKHLQSKPLLDGTTRTWLNIYTQHIADEPLNENLASWEGLARQVKQAAPKIRIIEAYRAATYNPAWIDILVPQLDEFAEARYREVPASHSCWFYTCMYPRANFANRYVVLPLIKTRLLHWINFKYASPGYLHWGFNFWGENGDPFGDVSAPANDWAGGDSHIVYPGYRKLYPSIRLAAMRDGIRDYELLRLVAAKDPARAQALVDAVVFDFDRYDTSVGQLRRIRHSALEFLSGAE